MINCSGHATMFTPKRRPFDDTMAGRLRAIRNAAEAAWRILENHQIRHRCNDWVLDKPRDQRCPVRDLLVDAWITLDKQCQLPSPDPRMYR